MPCPTTCNLSSPHDQWSPVLKITGRGSSVYTFKHGPQGLQLQHLFCRTNLEEISSKLLQLSLSFLFYNAKETSSTFCFFPSFATRRKLLQIFLNFPVFCFSATWRKLLQLSCFFLCSNPEETPSTFLFFSSAATWRKFLHLFFHLLHNHCSSHTWFFCLQTT